MIFPFINFIDAIMLDLFARVSDCTKIQAFTCAVELVPSNMYKSFCCLQVGGLREMLLDWPGRFFLIMGENCISPM